MTKYFLVIMSFFLQSCFLASQTKFINANPDQITSAGRQVFKSTDMKYEEGLNFVTLYAKYSTILTLESKKINSPTFYAYRSTYNSLNKTDLYGTIEYLPSFKGTLVKSTFITTNGDALANANLFLELINQQVEIDQNLRKPYHNSQKSALNFIGINTFSPTLGSMYLIKDNPLIGRKSRKNLIIYNSVLEILSYSLLTTGLLMNDPKQRNGLIGSGLTTFAISRTFSLLNLIDLFDYKRIARSPYNLREIPVSE